MKADFTPIKTEYMGTVFDSKSEAVFARVLHQLGHEYVYHPIEHCGHEWDFLVFRKAMFTRRIWAKLSGRNYVSETVRHDDNPPPILVEYKPSSPTKTYISNLTSKTSGNPFESVLVWGSPWSGVQQLLGGTGTDLSYVCYPIFTSHDRFGWGDFCQMADNGYDCNPPFSYRHTFSDMFGCHSDEEIQAALNHRFDLRHA